MSVFIPPTVWICFVRSWQLPSKVSVPNASLLAMDLFLQLLAASIWSLGILGFSHSNKSSVLAHFNFQFPNDTSHWEYFHMLTYHLYVFFGEASEYFPLIKLPTFLSLRSYLYSPIISPLADMPFANVFSMISFIHSLHPFAFYFLFLKLCGIYFSIMFFYYKKLSEQFTLN